MANGKVLRVRRVIQRNRCALQHERGERLLPFRSPRHAKFHTAIFVRLGRGSEIDLGQRDPFRALRREDPERLAYDRVIVNLLPALITKHEYGSLPGLICFIAAGTVSRRRRGGRGINILILLLAESLLLEASLVHLFRQG
jgi:hypothetical protein